MSLTCFCYWSAQGGVGPQVGCGIGVSNCVIPRAEPADTIAASKTRRKAFFTVMFSFDLSSQTVSDILAYIRNKAMDLMRVPNPQQKIPKMGIAVSASSTVELSEDGSGGSRAGYKSSWQRCAQRTHYEVHLRHWIEVRSCFQKSNLKRKITLGDGAFSFPWKLSAPLLTRTSSPKEPANSLFGIQR